MRYDWGIIGHGKPLSDLEQEIATGNLSHAYLFSGPRQVGKFRIGRLFASILQCTKDFCRTCPSCKAAAAKVHPDITLLPDDGQSIGIDAIRRLIGQSSLAAQSLHRIFVIENIERMPLEAQNSFLKTLEEPPGRTVFILTSSRISDVLPTVLSRVRHYAFFSVGDTTMRAFLAQRFPRRTEIDEVVNIAQGRPGLAINLMEMPDLLRDQRELYATIERFLRDDNLAGKFLFTETLAEGDGAEVRIELFFDAFARYLRKLLFEYMKDPSHPLAARFPLASLVDLFESLEKTRYLIRRNANKKLALENFFLQTETADHA